MSETNKKCKILIVDDTPKNIQVVASILREEEYQMAFACNGKEALDQTKSANFDLILLDIMMPKMDGYEVCERLKADPATQEIPVIFLTAKTETASIVKGFEFGAVDYVTKPFRKEELLARVRTHLYIRKLQLDLQEVNAAKDKFFSIIAHDLRGPLGALHNVTQLIIENIKNFSRDTLIETFIMQRDAAKNLLALLENLLTWSRIQRGMIEYHPQQTDVERIVHRNLALLTPHAEQKQITLHNSIQPKLIVYADVNMVDTVVRNLLSNALKFTDTGGNITISATPHEQYVDVSVSDTGVGISAKGLSKLFRIDEPYQRQGTADEEGTGLGLVLCQELVEKNGGTIRVESETGQGTTFTFSLQSSQPAKT